MRKYLVPALGFMSVISLLAGCSDNSTTSVTNNTIIMLGQDEKMSSCEGKSEGKMVYVPDSAAIYFCAEGKWIALNGKDGTDGKDGKDGSDGKDGKNGTDGKDGVDGKGCAAVDTVDADGRVGYNVDCDNGRVGTLWNGVDGKDGVDGKGCTAADTSNEFGVVGYNMTCNGERVGTIWNGSNGADGASCMAQDTVSEDGVYGVNIICGGVSSGTLWSGVDGVDGEPCYIKKLDAGYEIDCGSDNIIDLYNGFCGTTPYDPAGDKFCYGVNLYDKCNGEAYDVTKKFCYNETSIENLCGTSSYNLSTQFCYSSKVYARCNGKTYNPGVTTCSNNKLSQSVTFSVEAKTSASASKNSLNVSNVVTIPAGVSSVAMTVSGVSYGATMQQVKLNVGIAGQTQTITFTSSLGSTSGSTSPTSKTFTFTALTSAQNMSITNGGGGAGQTATASGKLTFTYTP